MHLKTAQGIYSDIFKGKKRVETYIYKFYENASDCPNVDFWSVLCVAHQEFGGTVPTGGHVVCELVTGG